MRPFETPQPHMELWLRCAFFVAYTAGANPIAELHTLPWCSGAHGPLSQSHMAQNADSQEPTCLQSTDGLRGSKRSLKHDLPREVDADWH